MVTIPDLLAETARRHPDAPALTSGTTTLTYAQLHGQVGRVARHLPGTGVARGDRVAVLLDKHVETVVTIFAVAAAGAVVVPVNPQLRPRQVRHVLEDCAVTALVTAGDRLPALRGELAEVKSLETVHLVDPDADTVGPPDPFVVRRWADLLAATPMPAPSGPACDADVAAVLYTSGSTGRPKGVVLSHRNLVVGAQSVSGYLEMSPSDRILAALPLSFDAGLSQLTTSFAVGAHVILINYLVPRDVVRVCAEHCVTGLTGVPPLWIQLAEQDWPPEAARSLRFFANTGGRMPRATLDRLRALFPAARPYLMYGLTEAFRSTYLPPDEVDRRPDSIGKAIPNAEVLVVREDGSPCDAGEEGELVHRGPLVCLGYWNDPERTAQRFRPTPRREPALCLPETAVWSGDVVVRDEEGFLYFVGRRDEMIKTSGYRVSPSEVEEVAYEVDAVQDAVAIGVADARLGQRIVLLVTARTGHTVDEAALLAAMRRGVPRYMVPRHISVRPGLPRSPNGKFDRAVLRDEWDGGAR